MSDNVVPFPEPEPPPYEEPEHQQDGIVPLGHDRGIFYYLSRSSGQVIALPIANHTRNSLMALASIPRFWQRSRFATDKGAIMWEDAIDWLMSQCRDIGIFDPDRLRGRGAWLDDNRSVLHLGDRLLVDGESIPLGQIRSQFIYEHTRTLALPTPDTDLSAASASALMGLCMAAPWEDPDSMGRLLAGWCVIAPVCGAMPWRPHLWITSESGGGKSWILDNIIRPLLGNLAVQAQSKTTEAGLRGELGIDARPVVFDEFESQNEADRARVQQVLDLARQASSENGADILKGTQTGGVRRYRIRSCFAFASINPGMTQAADESRTVVLTLKPHTDPAVRAEAFHKLQELHAAVMKPDFPAALLARTLRLLPVIRANADLFATAIARSGSPRRTGDTIGVILAGAWSLRSSRIATEAEADAFLQSGGWVKTAVTRNEAQPEWRRALSFLIQQRIRVTTSNHLTDDIPVGELLNAALSAHTYSRVDNPIPPRDASLALSRAGIKLQFETGGQSTIAIANTSTTIAGWFSKTSWAAGWASTISRAPGAVKENKTHAFGPLRSKALILPINVVLDDDGSDNP